MGVTPGLVATASSAVLTETSRPSSSVRNTRSLGPENSEFLSKSMVPSSACCCLFAALRTGAGRQREDENEKDRDRFHGLGLLQRLALNAQALRGWVSQGNEDRPHSGAGLAVIASRTSQGFRPDMVPAFGRARPARQ